MALNPTPTHAPAAASSAASALPGLRTAAKGRRAHADADDGNDFAAQLRSVQPAEEKTPEPSAARTEDAAPQPPAQNPAAQAQDAAAQAPAQQPQQPADMDTLQWAQQQLSGANGKTLGKD